MISKILARSFALILIFSITVLAQQPAATPPTEEQRRAQQELERKTLALLDDVIKEADSFKQAENRIQVKASSAYILWKYDEARARILFRDVMASFTELLNNQPDADAPESARIFGGVKMLQGEIAQMLAARDPRMAREFLRATRPPNPQPGKEGSAAMDPDEQMDMSLAVQVAERDPKLSLEIAEERLAKGWPNQLLSVVTSLQAKDPEAASKLAGEIMAKLRSEKLADSDGARQTAIALLTAATVTTESGEKEKEVAATKTPLLEQAEVRELAEMLAGEALRGSGNYEMMYMLRSAMPAITKYAPARAAQLKQKFSKATGGEGGVEEFEADDSAGMTFPDKMRSLMEKGSADELLTAASAAEPPMREWYYQRAAVKLAEDDNAEHARQIINEKVQDPNQRKTMLEQIDKAASMAEAERGKVEQSRRMLAALRTNEERAQLLAQLAIGAQAKGEKKIALKFLEEASAMINQRARNVRQLGAQLAVAHAFVQVEPARAFAILEPVVDQLNELLGAATLLYGFMLEEVVRDDELMLRPIVTLLGFAGGEVFQYVNDLAVLARADFERTKNLVDRFQRGEARILMRMMLAQSVLDPSPALTKFSTERYYGRGVVD